VAGGKAGFMEAASTRERIMDVAIMQFSDRGYDLVSMRDIAKEVGIKASSIYNHFPSKRDILLSSYEFYAHQHRLAAPSLETLLHRVETEPIRDILMSMSYHWPPEIQDKMDRIILIGMQRMCMDKDSEFFIREHFFKPMMDIWDLLLNRAIELGKIEPIDVDSFICLATYYAFTAAWLNRTTMKIGMEQWLSSLFMLFSLLKPTKT
jgi:AcrR family transcriptional regulator